MNAGQDVKVFDSTDNRLIFFGSGGCFTFAQGAKKSYVGNPHGSFKGLENNVLIKEWGDFTTARLLVFHLE